MKSDITHVYHSQYSQTSFRRLKVYAALTPGQVSSAGVDELLFTGLGWDENRRKQFGDCGRELGDLNSQLLKYDDFPEIFGSSKWTLYEWKRCCWILGSPATWWSLQRPVVAGVDCSTLKPTSRFR